MNKILIIWRVERHDCHLFIVLLLKHVREK